MLVPQKPRETDDAGEIEDALRSAFDVSPPRPAEFPVGSIVRLRCLTLTGSGCLQPGHWAVVTGAAGYSRAIGSFDAVLGDRVRTNVPVVDLVLPEDYGREIG